MIINLQDKGNRFYPSAYRAQHANLEWLASVDDIGALAYNPEADAYLLFTSKGSPYVKLDTNEVRAALTVAREVVDVPKAQGRPALPYRTRIQSVAVGLNQAHIDTALALGAGNLSAGVRSALEMCGVSS